MLLSSSIDPFSSHAHPHPQNLCQAAVTLNRSILLAPSRSLSGWCHFQSIHSPLTLTLTLKISVMLLSPSINPFSYRAHPHPQDLSQAAVTLNRSILLSRSPSPSRSLSCCCHPQSIHSPLALTLTLKISLRLLSLSIDPSFSHPQDLCQAAVTLNQSILLSRSPSPSRSLSGCCHSQSIHPPLTLTLNFV